MNDVPTSVPAAQHLSHHAGPGARRGGRLVRRTFLVALALVCGGLLTSGGVELLFSYRESVEAIGALQREMAQGAAFKIQQFVLDIERTLHAATQTQDIIRSGLTEPYQFELLKVLKMTPAMTELVVLDTTGHERFIVSRARMVLPDDLRDRVSSEAFQWAQHGKTFFGQVYFVRESEPYMTMAVPIARFHGDVVGVLVAEVNLKYIWEVVTRIEVGKAGYAYVVSREGDLIAHPDISLVLQKRQVKQLSQVQAALAGASTRFVERPNLAGQPVFAAFATIPELGWAVLLERPVAEAYAPLYASVLRTGVLLLVGLGMAVLASLLLRRRVARPLALLQQGAARLGSGDLMHRFAVTTADEFQTLADEFNRMASQLQASYTGLEQKVEARTHELARSVQELQALEEISRAINATLDLQTVLTTIVSYAVQLSGADAGAVYEYDEATQSLSLRIAQELKGELLTTLRTTPLHLGEGAVGRAAAGRQPVQIPDVHETAPNPGPLRDVVARTGFRSLLAVPLMREDHVIGGLVVLRHAPGAFPPAVVDLLGTFATQSALAMQNARLFREIDMKGQQLELASRHKSAFLANMSHELRTPLNSIIGFSEVLLDESLGELSLEERREFLGNVLGSGRHLLTLINDILDLSKVEAGRMELYPETFIVTEVIRGVVQTIQPLAARKQIAIEEAIDPALRTLRADPGKVKQILFNLLSNAVKFTPVAGRIGVRAIRGEGDVHFVVWDTGIGIQPEDQARIFEEFQQVEATAARQYEGTGLGLTLAQKFVALHGGRIWVESTPGAGTTFTFTLPLVEPPTIPAEGDAAPQEGSQPLVLVVEDDAPTCELLHFSLAREGFRVAEAHDGEEAVAKARTLRPCLITLDIMLPKKDGWEVLRVLKDDVATREIPVVIVSMVDEPERGFSLGAADYILKPFDREDLLHRLARYGLTTHERAEPVHILIIDDDPMVVETLTGLLEPVGFRVSKAYGGQQGLEQAVMQPPDLIVVDLLMPEISGFEVVQRLKAHPQTQEIPVFVVTDKDALSEETQELNSLVAAIIHKEAFAKDAFLEDIGTRLRRMAAQQRRAQDGGRTDPTRRR